MPVRLYLYRAARLLRSFVIGLALGCGVVGAAVVMSGFWR